MSELTQLKRNLQSIAERRDNALAKFKTKLDEDPVHAFEWADETMQLVARGRIADHYIRSVAVWEEARDAGTLTTGQPQTEALAVDFIKQSIIRAALQTGSYVKRSTSVCSNFMAAEASATYADLANDWAFIS